MNARPILMNGPMVRASLDGRKTQTRRIIRPQPQLAPDIDPSEVGPAWDAGFIDVRCPYGQPGDLLYVRETWRPIHAHDDPGERVIAVDYAATYQHGYRLGDTLGLKPGWTPSIHMPRWASRLTLRITDVRVEQLQEISGPDCIAEGLRQRTRLADGVPLEGDMWREHKREFRALWESINGADSWNANPLVWVLSFDVIHANVDQVLKEVA